MKALLCLLLALSLPVFAQKHECPTAGTIISSQLLGEVGDEQMSGHEREGSLDIPNTVSFSGVIRTRVYQSFEDKHCVAKNYSQTEKVCEPISVDVALGKGNDLFISFYDLSRAILVRAEAFAKNIKYSVGQPEAERLEVATIIVSLLTKDAARAGIPRKWSDLAVVLNAGVKEGQLTLHVVEDITVHYQSENQGKLGFKPKEGSVVREAEGNGKLKAIFDLGLSPAARAHMIQELIKGVTSSMSMNLSRTFIDFANRNGIPNNWDGFVLMMKFAVTSGAINERTFLKITEELESLNREALGYQLSAEFCRMVEVTKTRNVVESKNRREFVREALKSYQVNVSGAPLLQDEKEVFSIAYEGTRPLTLKLQSAYNSYQLISQVEDNGITKLEVVGKRNAIQPRNTIKATLKMTGVTPAVTLQNLSYNPKAEGRILVKVRYINGRLFGDKELGVETYELKGTDLLNAPVVTRHKDIDFIKVSVQIVGSPYYSSDFSEEIKIKK